MRRELRCVMCCCVAVWGRGHLGETEVWWGLIISIAVGSRRLLLLGRFLLDSGEVCHEILYVGGEYGQFWMSNCGC